MSFCVKLSSQIPPLPAKRRPSDSHKAARHLSGAGALSELRRSFAPTLRHLSVRRLLERSPVSLCIVCLCTVLF